MHCVCVAQFLSSTAVFGRFGTFSCKFTPIPEPAYQLQFSCRRDAAQCIRACHGTVLMMWSLHCCFELTEYCHQFARGLPCVERDCRLFHQLKHPDDVVPGKGVSRRYVDATGRTLVPAKKDMLHVYRKHNSALAKSGPWSPMPLTCAPLRLLFCGCSPKGRRKQGNFPRRKSIK